ncbi:protein-tyrosine phosphatase [Rathayibacter sp. PhB152]|jgi:protein-tyrosine-phosphatase|uniref:arsenate reductase/protein-tyrosine-phosphatase family protein n=1 Tax=Rathayibacter sp. PhB152 TaxID=2485190 RepID=UPI000F4C3BA8|nr:hypothetical protein [Rathayibacter sp. PhB152]ROQ65160.1 protein-tyrosine phosphatase [Rathayibacter sp. PhB152]
MSSRLLFLCHANVARSPSAERLAAELLAGSDSWQVSSAGTHAPVGRGLDPDLGDALRARGLSVASHRARQADGRLLQDADLVLAFESQQREWVAQHFASAARRTATIRRAARLAQAAPGADLRELIARDTAPYGAEDDFADPHGRGAAVAASAVDEIDALLRTILPALGALPADWDPPRPAVLPTRRSLRRARESRAVAS